MRNSSLGHSEKVKDAVVIHMLANQTAPRTKLVKVVPALSALRHNVRYKIVSGNEDGFFAMHKKKGVSSLHFTRRVEHARTFALEVLCRPVERDERIGDKVVHLEAYHLHLEIHVEAGEDSLGERRARNSSALEVETEASSSQKDLEGEMVLQKST